MRIPGHWEPKNSADSAEWAEHQAAEYRRRYDEELRWLYGAPAIDESEKMAARRRAISRAPESGGFDPWAPAGSGPYRSGLDSIGPNEELWESPQNGLGKTALVMSVLGALIGLVPILFPFAAIFGMTGITMALIQRRRIRRERADNYKTMCWAFCAGIVAVALSILGAFLLSSVVYYI